MNYHCRSCKKDVGEVHLCGQTPKGAQVIVQYRPRYQPARRDGYLKTFGSMSEARKLARFQNQVEKGWMP